MDVGAHDGVSINNTLFFEEEHNWTGVNIEPLPHIYTKLVENRPACININCAVSNVDGEADFMLNEGYTEMLSGLANTVDDRHIKRMHNEQNVYGGATHIIKVPTKRVESICTENEITHIHYLSIDVEGAEFDVIKSINFDKVFIDVIGFENNYHDVSKHIIEYLIEKGYKVLKIGDDIFMMHNLSKFNN